MAVSLNVLSDGTRSSDAFYIGNMIPACIDNDRTAAMATLRSMLTSYARLPNYRNYWKQAGYDEEMMAVEAAIAEDDMDRVAVCLSDRLLADVAVFGSAGEVRDGIEAWVDSGIKTPIIVPKSASGGQLEAIREFFALWD
jgi:alkanesulfonate monooxygenase SsuD/methylene tetrahydromethanopterin reductase-like flavin-dependent oxidoreductase (luciferase family)